MSEVKKEGSQLAFLEQLKQNHTSFVQQKDVVQTNLNQLIGAIYACEVMIKKYENEELKQPLADQVNGETDAQEADKE